VFDIKIRIFPVNNFFHHKDTKDTPFFYFFFSFFRCDLCGENKPVSGSGSSGVGDKIWKPSMTLPENTANRF
jgi:hypothetical protein